MKSFQSATKALKGFYCLMSIPPLTNQDRKQTGFRGAFDFDMFSDKHNCNFTVFMYDA